MSLTSFEKTRNNIIYALVFCALLLAIFFSFAKPIDLVAVDIGRHIKNGELILAGVTDIFYKNYYSFTYPNYPFINHHWFFGVCSFLVYSLGGFGLVSFAFIGISILTWVLFFQAARLRGHGPLVLLMAAICLPLLTYREEIRPEGVSYLLMGVYFYVLTRLSLGRMTQRWAWIILIVCQIIWVNSHIFFFLGPLLVLIFWWEGAARGCCVCSRQLRPLFLMLLGACLFNPSGFKGALTPLNAFAEFGYRLAENQNVFFMMSRFTQTHIYQYYLVVAGVLLVGMVWAGILRGWKKNAPFMLLFIFAMAAGIKAVRLMSPAGYLFIPLGCFFWAQVESTLSARKRQGINVLCLVAALIISAVHLAGVKRQEHGFGLRSGINESAEFFKRHAIQGPIFSNYDIGGYLIYHLSPKYKVFVDNRQEAFPPEFFRDVYIPMQDNNAKWQEVDQANGFNAIFFYRHDMTPWGQNFLIARINDPAWAPVYVDGWTIIFLRRTAQNEAVINANELPKSMFGVSKRS